MTKQHCDRQWELEASRQGRLGAKDAEAFERHARTCEICGAARLRSQELDTWLEGASSNEVSPLDLRRIRIHVLRAAGTDDKPKIMHARLAFVAGCFLVAGALGVYEYRHDRALQVPVTTTSPPTGSTPLPRRFIASVEPRAGAHWSQTLDGLVEHVRLDDGALAIRVAHRAGQEKFVVDLPDGTIEDRGTTFDVEAHEGRTTHVAVTEGIVVLRVHGAAEIVLRAGDDWSPPAVVAVLPIAPVASNASATGARSTTSTAGEDDSAEYGAAVSMLRAHRYSEAATAFAAYVKRHPHEPDAEDASYLEAVALAQSGDAARALKVAEQHLSSYPKSFHRKEASLLVARLARDAGDCAKAEKILAPWLAQPADPDAVATLQSCAAR